MSVPKYNIIYSPASENHTGGSYHALKQATKLALLNGQTPITPALVYEPFLNLIKDTAVRNDTLTRLSLKWANTLIKSEHPFEIQFALTINHNKAAPELTELEEQLHAIAAKFSPKGRGITCYPDFEAKVRDVVLEETGDITDLRTLKPFNEKDQARAIDAIISLSNNNNAKATVIESPFKGDVKGHLDYAYQSMINLMDKGHLPFGSHFTYTQVLDDKIQEERTICIYSGLEMYHVCPNSVYLLDMGASGGMQLAFDAQGQYSRECEYLKNGVVSSEPTPDSGLTKSEPGIVNNDINQYIDYKVRSA
jgi:hypothetical protein